MEAKYLKRIKGLKKDNIKNETIRHNLKIKSAIRKMDEKYLN